MSEGRVTLIEGVEYATAGPGGRPLRCDVFLPPGLDPDARVPAVVLIHGGAWILGDPTQLRGYGFLIAREGFVCIAPEYRLAKDDDASTRWPAQLHDVKAAVRWLRSSADRYQVDPDAIVASGNSAGAHLALMLAATADCPEFEGSGGSQGSSSRIQGAVSMYGITHIGKDTPLLPDAVAKLMGPDATRSAYAGASPMSYVGGSWPPVMLMHSNLDDLVPVRQSLDLYEALRAAGNACELHLYDGQPHAFDAEPSLGRQSATLIVSFVRRFVKSDR